MSKFTDPQYLKSDQYRDESNLDARVVIHKRFSTNRYGWMAWVFDHLPSLPKDAQILELGCGPGYLWQENIERIPPGWRITLSDLSAGMLDAAWRNLVVSGRAFQFQEIDAQSIPLEDESFYAVIANHMLYHVPDRPQAIAEIKRILKPGGRLIATTVGEHHLEQMMARYRQVHDSNAWESFANPFTLENGREQLEPYFSRVNLFRYGDSLRVTEIQPLIEYIRSSIRATELSEEELAGLASDLEKEMQESGRILISKDSGLFEAVK